MRARALLFAALLAASPARAGGAENPPAAPPAPPDALSRLESLEKAFLESIMDRRREIEDRSRRRRAAVREEFLARFEAAVADELAAYREVLSHRPRTSHELASWNGRVREGALGFQDVCRAAERELGPLGRDASDLIESERRRALAALDAERRTYLVAWRRERDELFGRPPAPPDREPRVVAESSAPPRAVPAARPHPELAPERAPEAGGPAPVPAAPVPAATGSVSSEPRRGASWLRPRPRD
jgi:hypothetical protein